MSLLPRTALHRLLAPGAGASPRKPAAASTAGDRVLWNQATTDDELPLNGTFIRAA